MVDFIKWRDYDTLARIATKLFEENGDCRYTHAMTAKLSAFVADFDRHCKGEIREFLVDHIPHKDESGMVRDLWIKCAHLYFNKKTPFHTSFW